MNANINNNFLRFYRMKLWDPPFPNEKLPPFRPFYRSPSPPKYFPSNSNIPHLPSPPPTALSNNKSTHPPIANNKITRVLSPCSSVLNSVLAFSTRRPPGYHHHEHHWTGPNDRSRTPHNVEQEPHNVTIVTIYTSVCWMYFQHFHFFLLDDDGTVCLLLECVLCVLFYFTHYTTRP